MQAFQTTKEHRFFSLKSPQKDFNTKLQKNQGEFTVIAYKHDLYLIERTKLLEGIVCQSITFTNTLGHNYLNNPYLALTNYTYKETTNLIPTNNYRDRANECFGKLFTSPKERGTIIPVGSVLKEALEEFLYQINIAMPDGSKFAGSGRATIVNDSETTAYQTFNGIPNIDIGGTLSISCNVACDATVTDGTTSTVYSIDVEFAYIIAGVENRYPPKPYTITDCINRVLELAEPLFVGQNPRYVLDGVTYENGEIKPYSDTQKYAPGSLAEKYDNIQAPEFTMTQCTLREQLKVIGGFIHAEPRLEYPNKITFVPYCLGTQAEIGQLPYIQDSKEQSLNEYCTEIVTNAQNLVNSVNYAKGVIIEPNLNYYKTVRTETVNVKLSEPISLFETQCPIYSVQKLMVGLYNANGGWDVEPIDITPFVFERHEYNNLSSYKGNYPYVKSYAVYYTQGENNINGLFFKPETQNPLNLPYLENYAIVNILQSATGRNDIKDLITNNFQYLSMQLTYIPVFSAMFSHGKQYRLPSPQQPFQTVYNQSENLIESSWYGEHIKGVSARLGNVEQTRTYKVKRKALIPRVGQMIDDYYISTVATDLTPFYYKVTVGLTKDFNRISQYVGINSTKRVSEVSEKQAYQRNILIKEYICLGDRITDTAIICGSKVSTLKLFNLESASYRNPLTMCIAGTKAKNKTEYINKVMLPVVSSAMGNTMTFCWTYKDNYSAGTEVTKGEEVDGNIDGFWQTDIPYCDYYGRAFAYDFQLNNARPSTEPQALAQALTCEYNGNFDTNNTYIGTVRTGLFIDKAYRLRKDSREILNFNYCLEYVTNRQDLNIGSALASNNPLVTTFDGRVSKVYFFNEEIDKFITNIKGLTPVAEGTVAVQNVDEIHFDIPTTDFKSWAIAYPVVQDEESTKYSDEDGNVIEIYNTTGGEVLLSSNKSKTQYGETQDEVITIGLYA